MDLFGCFSIEEAGQVPVVCLLLWLEMKVVNLVVSVMVSQVKIAIKYVSIRAVKDVSRSTYNVHEFAVRITVTMCGQTLGDCCLS